ncbi:MAG: hypothetical protein JRF59_06040 [Deltaproteobacteria bacterium]|nr:hypothetical protein [Deltaproteobacteria bacterium]MBW1921877.1 hypothetical protein [Deltaproteobacteria bacterium]MBW1948040.1 hypothetical protein [Deltaproteobacteria bacterium]MBW2006925.1 hypothetical protein [Deltaproteobacteria bacterium]MBW2102332.1 hypothetical protein [Deltaproteobacteria bacterium]
MPIPGNLLTTAMAVMPHKNVDRALSMALSLDIPFWPQLPLYSYYEDMYVQASEHFPGIMLDMEKRTLRFSTEKFMSEVEEAMNHFEEPEYFDISNIYSVVYHRFLDMDLSKRAAIRGQLEGPISFGFNVVNENDRPILFDDTVRPFLYEFMARRINVQLLRLKKRNPNAFMFVDEPGLQYLFSAMSGYNDVDAHADMEMFFGMIDRPRGVHLCGNPDWDFLLSLDLDILSLDVYSNGEIFASYAKAISRFLDRGGVLVWGMVPTNFEPFEKEDMDSMAARLEEIWKTLGKSGIDREFLLSRSLISPATCCLVNPDGEKTVEKAFGMVTALSRRLREENGLEG